MILLLFDPCLSLYFWAILHQSHLPERLIINTIQHLPLSIIPKPSNHIKKGASKWSNFQVAIKDSAHRLRINAIPDKIYWISSRIFASTGTSPPKFIRKNLSSVTWSGYIADGKILYVFSPSHRCKGLFDATGRRRSQPELCY